MIEIVVVEVCDPSIMLSSTPVRVTVCAEFQFAAVKVRVPVTVASPVSPEEIENTTSEDGCAFSTTVKVSVVPDSETLVDPPDSITVNPATSLSVVVTETVWSATPSKLSFELPSLTATVMVEVMVPSMRLSSTPVTVTVCAEFQFAEVKVSELVTVASPVSPEVIESTTSEVGPALSTTVKVSVVPVSATLVDPLDCAIVNPAVSLSVVVTDTVWSATGSKLLSELPSFIATVIVEVCAPSTRLSSTPVTVTVCAEFQFPDVKVSALVTVASPVSPEVTARTTFDAGCAFSTTVKVSVVPVSATLVDPPDSTTVNPATSLSAVATETVLSGTESKASSELASTILTVMVEV